MKPIVAATVLSQTMHHIFKQGPLNAVPELISFYKYYHTG